MKKVIKDYEDYIYNHDNRVISYSDVIGSHLMSYDSFYKMKRGKYEYEQAKKYAKMIYLR